MSEEEFERVLERNKNMVLRLAFSYLRNMADAEDVSQDVFIKYYNNNIIFNTLEQERAWLIRVTINRCHDIRKSAWFRKRVQLNEIQAITEIEDEQEILQEVLSLTDKYRIIIYLYYYEEYSVSEIADITGRKISTVQTQLKRARELLRKRMMREEKNAYEKLQTSHE
ncbi:MAG: sigma-70 family RNA polymerase sigma factor [Lachnospiraceae bacterium]|nr:sigma-70 family RNA polymerase sigma factor [Lachnospiraceae bacterium]